MSDFLWSRLAFRAGLDSLEQLVLILAGLALTAMAVSCWRHWTRLTPVLRAWAPVPDTLEPAGGAYGARQLIESYPAALRRGVVAAGGVHLAIALAGMLLLGLPQPPMAGPEPPKKWTIVPNPFPPTLIVVEQRGRVVSPPPLELPDPRKVIPSALDIHVTTMDSADMAVALGGSVDGSLWSTGTSGSDSDGASDWTGGHGGWGPPGESDPDPSDVIPVDQVPELIWIAAPVYPDMARLGGLTGRVDVLVLVDIAGHVKRTRLARSIPGLDEAALVAARTARFKPALWRGRPVAVWVSIPIRFTLS